MSFIIESRWALNSSGCLLASMCPAPVRKASRTGAVNRGKGDSGALGSSSRKRDSHVIAASCPPNKECVGGFEAIMSATRDIMD
jgi:hypothetical protein